MLNQKVALEARRLSVFLGVRNTTWQRSQIHNASIHDLATFSNPQHKDRGLARCARAKPLSLCETCQVVSIKVWGVLRAPQTFILA